METKKIEEIKVVEGRLSEDQQNRQRAGLAKVVMRYPIGRKGRELLLRHIAESYL